MLCVGPIQGEGIQVYHWRLAHCWLKVSGHAAEFGVETPDDKLDEEDARRPTKTRRAVTGGGNACTHGISLGVVPLNGLNNSTMLEV
jgi:hypothetical protein